MSDSRKPDASQRQELAWLLDEADSAVQSWWQGEAVLWPDVLTKLVSRLRLCGFDLEAEGIASDVQATPKIGRRGCRNHRDLMQLRRAVVDQVRKRLVALRKVMAHIPGDESQTPAVKPRKTPAEYNIEARKYLQEHPDAGPRELQRALSCGAGTVYKLPAYKAVAEAKKKGRKPKAVSLTKPMADVTAKADGDGELAKLTREQRRDDRTHKVSSRERL